MLPGCKLYKKKTLKKTTLQKKGCIRCTPPKKEIVKSEILNILG